MWLFKTYLEWSFTCFWIHLHVINILKDDCQVVYEMSNISNLWQTLLVCRTCLVDRKIISTTKMSSFWLSFPYLKTQWIEQFVIVSKHAIVEKTFNDIFEPQHYFHNCNWNVYMSKTNMSNLARNRSKSYYTNLVLDCHSTCFRSQIKHIWFVTFKNSQKKFIKKNITKNDRE
jgi:hypothetical protein